MKTTIKVMYADTDSNKIYDYEVTKIELLSGIGGATDNGRQSPRLNNSISLANLLNGVEFSYEKGKKNYR